MTELAVQAPRGLQGQTTLVDMLDRVLGKGVVVSGDLVLSVADLDLVYINLRTILSSVATLEKGSLIENAGLPPPGRKPLPLSSAMKREAVARKRPGEIARLPSGVADPRERLDFGSGARDPGRAIGESRPGRLHLDPQKTQQGLVKLALTLVNLIRKLMERQAIRRLQAGGLRPEQVERAGEAFRLLEEEMASLKKQFDLNDEDLNLDLGPLGKMV